MKLDALYYYISSLFCYYLFYQLLMFNTIPFIAEIFHVNNKKTQVLNDYNTRTYPPTTAILGPHKNTEMLENSSFSGHKISFMTQRQKS